MNDVMKYSKKYSKEKIRECAEWVREHGLIDYGGATLKDFCAVMDIDDMTYYSWKKRPEFSEAIKKAKDEFRSRLQVRLEKSLARAAEGYEWEQVTTELENDEKGKPRIKRQTRKNIRVEPNVGAAIFLLTNLDPEKWKNRQDKAVKMSGDAVTVVVRSDEEKDRIEKMKELEV